MPIDWWCLALTCKAWSPKLQKHLAKRRIETFRRIEDLCRNHAVGLKQIKDGICLIPCHYGNLRSGCLGEVKRWTCTRHRTLSTFGVDLCLSCKDAPVSPDCYEQRCDKLKCRDYLFILRGGKAIKIQGYPCRIQDCQYLSDSSQGWCYNHALKASHVSRQAENEKYECLGRTQADHPCRFNTPYRSQKCHLHAYKYT